MRVIRRDLVAWTSALGLSAAALTIGCASNAGESGEGRKVDMGRAPGMLQGGAGGAAGSTEIPGGNFPPMTAPPVARAGAGGAGSAGSGGGCASTSMTAEVERAPVDIVWAIDTSASMVDEIAAVQANITNFANMISMAGIDHHVVMLALLDIAAGTPLAADPAHYLPVLAPVGSNDALAVMLNTYDAYKSFLRPNASLHFVVVTDDESWVAAGDFQSQMETLAGKKFQFHSIASPDAPGPCIGECGLPLVCGAFAPGLQYYALSDATGGQKISVCTADWTQVFAPLQQAVIESAPLPCDYPIPAPPSGQTLDPNLVNMEFAPAGGAAELFPRADGAAACGTNVAWFYDNPAAPTRLQLCPSACDRVRSGDGGTINIAFGCESKRVVPE